MNLQLYLGFGLGLITSITMALLIYQMNYIHVGLMVLLVIAGILIHMGADKLEKEVEEEVKNNRKIN